MRKKKKIQKMKLVLSPDTQKLFSKSCAKHHVRRNICTCRSIWYFSSLLSEQRTGKQITTYIQAIKYLRKIPTTKSAT